MVQAVERERPDEILHLGDHLRDAQALADYFPQIPVQMVAGNCDLGAWGQDGPLLLERDGVKILMAHGHQWQVKSGPARAVEAARQSGADVLLYGHTHQAVCRQETGGLWVVDPGAAGGGRATYGVIELQGGTVLPRIVERGAR